MVVASGRQRPQTGTGPGPRFIAHSEWLLRVVERAAPAGGGVDKARRASRLGGGGRRGGGGEED